jgi:hypothetical protein
MHVVVPFADLHMFHLACLPHDVCLREPRLVVQGNTWRDVAQFAAVFTTHNLECGYRLGCGIQKRMLVHEGMYFMDRRALENCCGQAPIAEPGMATLSVPWPLHALSGFQRSPDEYIGLGVYLSIRTPQGDILALPLPVGVKLFLCDSAAVDVHDTPTVHEIPKLLRWAEGFRHAHGKICGIQDMHECDAAANVYLAPTALHMPLQKREKYGVVAYCECSVCIAGFALRSSDGCVPCVVFVCFDDGSHLWLEVATQNLAVLDPSVVVVRLQDHVHLSVFPMAIGAHYGRRSSRSRTLSVSLLEVHGVHEHGGVWPCFRAGLREDPGVVLTKAARCYLRTPLPFSWMRLAWLQALY